MYTKAQHEIGLFGTKALLEAGAAPDSKTREGLTVAEVATKVSAGNHSAIVEVARYTSRSSAQILLSANTKSSVLYRIQHVVTCVCYS